MLRGLLCAACAALFTAACSGNGTSSDVGSGADNGTPDWRGPDGLVPDAPASDAEPADGLTRDGPAGDEALAVIPDGALLKDLSMLPDGFNPANLPACNGKIYSCANGLDDDGDGLVDARDPECTGPCDNDEGSYELNIPGVNSAICQQDCYWDDDSGSGNDDCEWSLKCDPLSPGAQFSPPCPYDQRFVDQGKCIAQQTQACLDFCMPIAPNGCDCFGCCEIYVNGVKHADTVYLGSGVGCTSASPQSCAPCTQVPECLNDCGDCELCLGKTLADLPAKCWNFPPPPDAGVPDGGLPDGTPGDGPPADSGILLPIECPPGIDPCIDNSHCREGFYCVTGCCKSSIG